MYRVTERFHSRSFARGKLRSTALSWGCARNTRDICTRKRQSLTHRRQMNAKFTGGERTERLTTNIVGRYYIYIYNMQASMMTNNRN